MPRNCPSALNQSHKHSFGLSISTRTPLGSAKADFCRFCTTFGRVNSTRVSRTSRQKKTGQYFTAPFRTDNIKSHLAVQYSKKWSEYKELSDYDSVTIFDETSLTRPQFSHTFGPVIVVSIFFHLPIIDVVIRQIFGFDQGAPRSCSIFNLLHKNENETHERDVSNGRQLRHGRWDCGQGNILCTGFQVCSSS